MLDVLITVPHGADGNDTAAPLVARALLERLRALRLRAACCLNYADRLEVVDMNRPESRPTRFREAVAERLPARLLLDVHSFPESCGDPRFEGRDIVLLHTLGVQDRAWLDRYAELLRESAVRLGMGDFIATVEPAAFADDVVIQSVELGQPRDANMLAEHSEDSEPLLLACVHGAAIRALCAERLWS